MRLSNATPAMNALSMIDPAEGPNRSAMKSCTAGCLQAPIIAAARVTAPPTKGSLVAADMRDEKEWVEKTIVVANRWRWKRAQ